MKYLSAILKFILFFSLTFGVYLTWFFGSIFIPNKQYWRELLFRLWAKGFVEISKIEIKIIGNPPKQPFFLVSNHLSYVDIPVLRAVAEGIFIAKSDIRNWFLVGKMIADFGNIFVNRNNRRDIPRAGNDILQALNRNEGIIVFPEGTSTNGEKVLPFKSSFLEFAANHDFPVHYVSITYQTPFDEPSAGESVCWWDETSFIPHLWRFFQLRKVSAIINFGEKPIQNANRKELAKELWQAVSEKFIPVS